MTDIPEGFGIIAGRGTANARAALAAAEAAGLDPGVVKAVGGGYLVPDAVLAAFHEAAGAEPASAEPDETPTSEWKNVEIKEWADARDIDLDGASTKADMLAAIAAATGKE
jgi:hypothetical protein